MRAIAGIIHFDGAPVPRVEIHRMLATMAIGPTDSREIWNAGPAGLAHLLKHLLPEDRFEAQPLPSADGNRVVVTDAILDNRDELAAAFGWRTSDASVRPDSAYVLAAYQHWGEECPSHLEGRFALAVWQRRERRLFCAIDAFGTRPLYLWRGGQEWAFATTLRGLFALPQIPRVLDEDVLASHCVGIPPADSTATLYRGITRLLGGHRLTVDAGGCRIVRYWNPDPARVLRLDSDAEYQEAFDAELERAVRLAIQRGPRNVGLMLSGGLDSCAIAAVTGKLLAAQGRRLQAIHLVPEPGDRTAGPLRELNESRFVEALRRHAPHIDFHFLPPSGTLPLPVDWDAYFDDNLVPAGAPPIRPDPAGTSIFSELDIGVQLNGGGGNYLVSLESFPTGYLTHLFFTGRWLPWWREIRGDSRVYGRSPAHLIRLSTLRPLKLALFPRGPTPRTSPLFLLHPALRARTGIEDRLRGYQASWSAPPVDFRKKLHRVLTELAREQIGVTPSVIGRRFDGRLGGYPMMDRRFNEFCLSLPFDQQIRDGWDRRLLRESMRGLLPDEIRLRVTRGLAQPQRQRDVRQSEGMLQSELERMRANPDVGELIALEWLRSRWAARDPGRPQGEYRDLVAGVTLGRFIDWHNRH